MICIYVNVIKSVKSFLSLTNLYPCNNITLVDHETFEKNDVIFLNNGLTRPDRDSTKKRKKLSYTTLNFNTKINTFA